MRRPLPSLSGILLLLSTACAAQVRAADVTAQSWVDSTRYLVGDWITVHVELRHPRGVALKPAVGDSLEGFRVIHALPPKAQTDTSEIGGFVLSKFEPGPAPIPPITYFYSLPGDTAPRSVATRPIAVTVNTVPVDTTKDIRDLKPPLSIPMTLAEIAMYAAIVLAVLALAFLAYRFWKKRKEKKSGAAYVPPPRPAHVIALEELALLKEKKLWQQGLIKQYYSEVTDILRRYLENRYRMPALEETTDEIMAGLQRLRFTPDLLSSMETILRRSDLVKFAKSQPAIPEHEQTFTVVYDVVERTKVVPAASEAATDTKVSAHVAP